MQIGLVTIFPKMFDSLKYGVIGRALEKRLLTLSFWNPRDYTSDTNAVDDRPYGGGPGMVMKFEPLQAALTAAKLALGQTTKVIYLSPQGKLLTQTIVAEKASSSSLFILVSGRYEGIDERLIEAEIDEEWSIGDYIVSGGELPAMIFIDAITRLIPGVLGHKDSAYQDSFTSGLLDFPHYTRPKKIANRSVPSVLLSGNHAAIARWRLKKSIGRTWKKRSDLLQRYSLTRNEQWLLDEFIGE